MAFDSSTLNKPFGVGPVIGSTFALLFGRLPFYGVLAVITFHSLEECFSAAAPRLLPVIVASILVAIVIALGFVLLIVPGLILATMLWVVIPVIVIERMGPFGSLGRSGELTKGFRWPIFGVVLILFLIGLAIGEGLPRLLLPAMGPGNVGLYVAINAVIEILLQMLGAIAAAYSYFHLKVAKEGADIDQLSQVFA